MKSTVENLNPTKVKLAIEVPYEEFKPEMDKVFKEYAKQVNIPGFRRGHVPARVLESYIGRGAVIEDAVNHALPEYYGQAVQEHKIAPMGQPNVDVTDTPNIEGEAGGDLKFTVEVEVRPEVKLPDFSKLSLEVDAIKDDPKALDTELDNLRRRFATLKTVERAVKQDDFVTLDLKTEVDGKEVDSLNQTSYHVGAGGLVEGLDEALKGLKAGATKTFETQLKSGPHGGQTAQVTVTVDSVKEQVLPEADDEFAMMVSEHDTIDELKQELAENVDRQARAGQAMSARDKLVEKLRDELEFPLPQGVLDEAVAAQAGEDASEEDKQKAQEAVEQDLKVQIILDALAEERQMNVSQQELLEFVLQTAQAYGMDPSMLLQSAEQNNRIPAFIQEIARNKSIASALGEVEVKDTNGKVVDLKEFIGEESAEDEDSEKKPAKKAPAKKAPAKKAAAKKAPAKKAPAKKTPAKKAPAKKNAADE